jgi:hypothetical protein
VNGVDNLGVVDAAQVHRGDREIGMAKLTPGPRGCDMQLRADASG